MARGRQCFAHTGSLNDDPLKDDPRPRPRASLPALNCCQDSQPSRPLLDVPHFRACPIACLEHLSIRHGHVAPGNVGSWWADTMPAVLGRVGMQTKLRSVGLPHLHVRLSSRLADDLAAVGVLLGAHEQGAPDLQLPQRVQRGPAICGAQQGAGRGGVAGESTRTTHQKGTAHTHTQTHTHPLSDLIMGGLRRQPLQLRPPDCARLVQLGAPS